MKKTITLEREGREPLTLEADPAVFDDMEVLETLEALERRRSYKLARLAAQVLGEEQKAQLYDWARDEDGRVPISAVDEALTALINSMSEAKN